MKRRPELALLHPTWLVALAVLALNDHVWKRSGVVPLTGKISDFAGLFVAPALLAALVRASTTRALAACHAAVAIGFALVKTWVPATQVFDALLSVFLPSKTVTDPTDLVALPMILVAWRVLVPQMQGHEAHVAHRLAMILGCGLCVATSPAASPLKLTIENHSQRSLTLDIEYVKSTLSFECSYYSADPKSSTLTQAMFVPAKSSTLLANKSAVIKYEARGLSCDAYLIRVTDLPPLVIAGRLDDGGTFTLAIDEQADGTLRWRDTAVSHLVTKPLDESTPAAECVPPDDRLARWSGAVEGTFDTSITRVVDECIELQLGGTQSWNLCIPFEAWPFDAQATITYASYDGETFDWVTLTSGGTQLLIGRGSEVPAVVGLPQATFEPGACTGVTDACGALWQNGKLRFTDGVAAAGEHFTASSRDVWVTQAARRPVLDVACSYGADAPGVELGYVVVTHPQ